MTWNPEKEKMMRKFLDYILSCLKIPSLIAGFFLTYLKLSNYLFVTFKITVFPILQKTLADLFAFINLFYEVIFIYPLNFFLQSINLGLPNGYATLAFFSTILYSSQTASMKLYEPLSPYSMNEDELIEWEVIKTQISKIEIFILEIILKMILFVHIPVSKLARMIEKSLPYENLQGKSIGRIFKVILGGFFLLGFMFLIYDLLIALFYRYQSFKKLKDHIYFIISLFVALLIALLSAAITVFVIPEILK